MNPTDHPARPDAALEQALASAAIEGHEPTADFLADAEAVARGAMTPEQARAASLARAQAADSHGPASDPRGA